jgi:hypothetical protein
MTKINWTDPPYEGGVTYATLEGDDKRFADISRTYPGLFLWFYPSGATGEAKGYRIASVDQGKRFLARWVAHHEAKVRRRYLGPAATLYRVDRAVTAGAGSSSTCADATPPSDPSP